MREENASSTFYMLSVDDKLHICAELQLFDSAQWIADGKSGDEEELEEETLDLVSAARKTSYQSFIKSAKQIIHTINTKGDG